MSVLIGERPGPAVAETPEARARAASAGTRVAAGVLDAGLLLVALGFILGTELAVASESEVELFSWGWFLLFAPLFFALYHAYGTGGTPGQTELRIGLRDTATGERPGLARALLRAYLGLVFLVLVVPALIDLAALATGRSLRDRMSRTAPVVIVLEGRAPELVGPTAPEVAAIFDVPAGTHRYLRRGWSLLFAQPRLMAGSVVAVYAVLAAIAVLLGFLIVADWPDEWTLLTYLLLVIPLLVSGVYWTQAASVLAAEEVRVGGFDTGIWATLVRASRRVNALTAALVLLLLLSLFLFFFGMWLLLPLLILGRVTLIAPALVLEDTRVLGAFRRSWQLTRGQTWRLLGFVLLSAAMLTGTLVVAGWLSDVVIAMEPSGLGALALALQMLVVFVPSVLLLAWLGAAWSLVYEDARRARPPGGDG